MILKKPESVLVVIYDEDRHILALQREDDPTFWQSVTGSLEGEETPQQTALREVKEETSIDIDLQGYTLFDTGIVNQYEIRPQWRHRYAKGLRFNTEYVFLLQVNNVESIQLTEHLSYQWLKPHAAIAKMWSETNKNAIHYLINYLDTNKQQDVKWQ